MCEDLESIEYDSSWLSQLCSEHNESLQPAPREGEEFVFASLWNGKDVIIII